MAAGVFFLAACISPPPPPRVREARAGVSHRPGGNSMFVFKIILILDWSRSGYKRPAECFHVCACLFWRGLFPERRSLRSRTTF